MATRLGGSQKVGVMNAVSDFYDAGGPFVLRFYSGAQPANSDAAATGTLLATITLPAPAFGASSDGGPGQPVTAAKAGTWSATVTATGTVGWARFVLGAGSVNGIDVSCGGPASGADIEFDDPDFVIDGTIVIDTFALSLPHST